MALTLEKSLSQFSLLRFISSCHNSPHLFLAYASARRQLSTAGEAREEGDEEVPTEGISRPLSVILRQLNKKVPESVIRVRHQDGFPVKYIPWYCNILSFNVHLLPLEIDFWDGLFVGVVDSRFLWFVRGVILGRGWCCGLGRDGVADG
ncbi:hypothetical protein Droror1_Dr00027679 [Drosera rotundifolia]